MAGRLVPPAISSEGMQMLGVRGMAIGAALTFGAVLWWATRGTEPEAEGSARLREASASHAESLTANAWTAPADRDDPADAPLPDEATADIPHDDSQLASDAGFDAYVSGKYRYLLEAVDRSSRGSEPLRAALMDRERLQVAINTARQGADETLRASLPGLIQQLSDADARIAQLLPATEIAAFNVLKDSHIEQFQLDDYAQGIANVAPIREESRRALMFSKLTSRARFREVLEQSGLMSEDFTPAQRQAAFPAVSRALRESHDSFLNEARQHLGDEQQYDLLANYENTEYTQELAKLRRIAGGG